MRAEAPRLTTTGDGEALDVGGCEEAAAEHATTATASNANPLKLPRRTPRIRSTITTSSRRAQRVVESLQRERNLVVTMSRGDEARLER